MKTTVQFGRAIAALSFVLIPLAVLARTQDMPTIIKGDLPKKVSCFLCSQNGENHGDEKPAGGVAYRGKSYYFCSRKEVEAFVKDPEAYVPAPVPRAAPAFSLKNVVGETVTMEQLSQGKVLLVDFWATWCGPCIKAMPEVQQLHDKYAAGGAFSAVGVSIDEEGAKKVAPFLAKQKTRYTYPMLLDSAATAPIWQQWGVKAVPSVILVKEGNIIGHWTGKVDFKKVEEAVAQAIGSSR